MKNLMVTVMIAFLTSITSHATMCENSQLRRHIDITADPSAKINGGVDISLYLTNGSLKVYSSLRAVTDSAKTYTLKADDGSMIKATFVDNRFALVAPATINLDSVVYSCSDENANLDPTGDATLMILQRIAGNRYQYDPSSPAFDRAGRVQSQIQNYLMSLDGVNGISKSVCHQKTGVLFSSLDFYAINPAEFEPCVVISVSTTQALTVLQGLMPSGYRYNGVLISGEFVGEITAQ